MVPKFEKIYPPALYRKSLLIPALKYKGGILSLTVEDTVRIAGQELFCPVPS